MFLKAVLQLFAILALAVLPLAALAVAAGLAGSVFLVVSTVPSREE